MVADRRPYEAQIGLDALVIRSDGSSINFGDAIYHPENADEARQYACDSLDAAWAAVEAALPEGWWMVVGSPNAGDSRTYCMAEAHHRTGMQLFATGPTPAAALLVLAERLREVK